MKLNRVLLINWLYYSKELLEFDQINLLSGKTGHGKSAFIDALQVVILGETRDNNFNKSSGNTKKDRKLIDYLKGRNDEGKFKRKGSFSSHICLEFKDARDKKFCYGIVFDCDGISEKDYRYYFLQDAIPENQFIQNHKVMSIDETISYIKKLRNNDQLNKSKVFTTNTEYKKNFMTSVGIRHVNFYDVFKKAVSYKPLENIPEFIVKYICSETKEIDLEKLSESMDIYKNLVQELEIAQKKRKLMDQIYDLTEEYKNKQKILMDETKKIEVFKYFDFSNELQISNDLYRIKDKELNEIKRIIESKNSEYHDKSDEYHKLKNAPSPIAALNEQIVQIKRTIDENKKYIENKKRYLCVNIIKTKEGIDDLMDNLSEDEISNEFRSINLMALSHELQKMKNSIDGEYGSFDESVFEKLADLQEALNKYIAMIRNQKNKLEKDLAVVEKNILQLKQGKKNYPHRLTTLKEFMITEMKRLFHKDVKVEIFADCFNVKDAEWKNAIEAYLHKQKMNLIIDPEYFMDAFKVFKTFCKNNNISGYSLVDVGKIKLKEKSPNITLFNKVDAQDKRALTYAQYLLDRVVCCEIDNNIRDHFTSMTKDGALYTACSGTQVSADLWKVPFIGIDSIPIQLAQAESDKRMLESRIDAAKRKINQIQIPYLNQLLNSKLYIKEYFEKIPIISDNEMLLKEKEGNLTAGDFEIMMKQNEELKKLAEEIESYETELDDLQGKKAGIELEHEALFKRIDTASKNKEMQEGVLMNRNINKDEYFYDSQKDYKIEIDQSNDMISECKKTMESNKNKVEIFKTQYNNEFHMSINTTIENEDYIREISNYSDDKIKAYIDKVNRAYRDAKDCFENQFFATLKRKIDNVTRELSQINRTIKLQRFGDSKYKFVATPTTDVEYRNYYEIIMSEDLNGRNLMNSSIYDDNKEIIDRLFYEVAQLNNMTQKEYEANGKRIEKYTHFTTYLDFDILENDNSLTKTISSKSGGETQTPFYIAILASLLNLYDSSRDSLRLVIFDEAFDKMDSERIEKSVMLLKDSGFQTIIATPTDKIPYIAPLANDTYVATTEIINGFKSSSLNRWKKTEFVNE
ncbi:MAG: AAA family ATPase [Erysipelotrichaceae bacterium]|nr:AAA family ATPase [Erysipelotrichaceae bacterium]